MKLIEYFNTLKIVVTVKLAFAAAQLLANIYSLKKIKGYLKNTVIVMLLYVGLFLRATKCQN